MRCQKVGLLAMAGILLLPEVLSAVDSRTEIPFRLFRDYTIIVQGSIGGLKKCNLLIDTGAVPTVLDRRVARKLRLVGKPEGLSVFTQSVPAEEMVLPDLRLGPIRAEAVTVLVRDLSFIEEGLGVRVDALLGLDVLGQSDFSIDYSAKKLTFGPVVPLESAFAMQAGPGFVYVTLQVQGQAVRLLVDTGTNHLLLFSGRVGSRLPGLCALGTKTSSNLGGEVTLKQVQLKEVRLGSNDFPTLEAFLLDNSGGDMPGFDGLLGVRSLGLTRLSFDFARQTISWK
jgi:predicted aspartyl protease